MWNQQIAAFLNLDITYIPCRAYCFGSNINMFMVTRITWFYEILYLGNSDMFSHTLNLLLFGFLHFRLYKKASQSHKGHLFGAKVLLFASLLLLLSVNYWSPELQWPACTTGSTQWPEFTAISLDGNELNIWKITASQGTRGGHWNIVWLISFCPIYFPLSVLLWAL